MAHRPTTRMDWQTRLSQAVALVHARLDSPPSGADLADAAGFSRYHFGRVFTAMVGESPEALIRRLRLERAAHRLVVTDQSVGEIALDAGYESPESFSRAFRVAFGVAPSGARVVGLVPRAPSRSGVHFQPDGSAPAWSPAQHEVHPMQIRIEEIPSIPLAAVRHLGAYHEIGRSFERLFALAGPLGICQPNLRTVGIYHDDPGSTPVADLRSDACMTVDPNFQSTGELKRVDIPAGKYVIGTYKGAYSGLGAAWGEFVGVELPKSGLEVREAPCFELYLNDCSKVPEEELLTELYMPVV